MCEIFEQNYAILMRFPYYFGKFTQTKIIYKMLKFILTPLFLILGLSTFAQKDDGLIKVTDMTKIKSLSNLIASPDGKKIIYTVTNIVPKVDNPLEYSYQREIQFFTTDGSIKSRKLTATGSEGSLQFSPDGTKIAFTRPVNGVSQIFLLDLVNGGEAYPITNSKKSIGSFKWSKDGKYFLFSSYTSFRDLLKDTALNPGSQGPTWNDERPGLANYYPTTRYKPDANGSIEEVRAYLDQNATDKKATVLHKLNHLSETDISNAQGFSHIWLLEAVEGSKPVPLTKGFFNYGGAQFTPDSKSIIYTSSLDSTNHPERVMGNKVFIMDIATKSVKPYLSAPDKGYQIISISPSGKKIIYAENSTNSFVKVNPTYIANFDNPTQKPIKVNLDRSVGNVTWTKDENAFYFTTQSNGGIPLFKADAKSGKVDRLTSYDIGINDYVIVNNEFYWIETNAGNPYEIHKADINGKNSVRITDFNHSWIKDKKISLPEKFTFKNEIGLEVEYWVMKPTNYEPGKKYPLLLEIHGGPSAMWGPGAAGMWHEYQYFASKGYGIVYGNPRGSGGYGEKFLRGNVNDWGKGPASDVLTTVDKTIQQGWVDTSKLLITGGSYAGYLTSWIIAHDHRFKAACAQRGVYDLLTFFGEGNAWRLVPNYFGGYPWEEKSRDLLIKESPITYVANIQTPLIIFHGDNDRRTGFVQSEMLYKSLKVLNKPVEYVRHPNATHEITRTGDNRQRIDQMLRTWEFFERYIRD